MITSNADLPLTHPNLLALDIEIIPFQSKNINYLDNHSQANSEIRSPSTSDSIIDRLVRGNQQFVEMRTQQVYHPQAICLSAVAQGKIPSIAVLNYARLTTSIEELFGQKFGELFTIDALDRSVSHAEIGAIEYSVLVAGVKALVVLDELRSNPDRNLDLGTAPRKYFKLKIRSDLFLIYDSNSVTADRTPHQTQIDLDLRIAQLQTSPVISRSISAENLQIIGGLYDRERGTVTFSNSIAPIEN